MPRHSVDPHASVPQREVLTRFLGRVGVDETDLYPGDGELARTHTTISATERNRFDNLCFKMGSNPASVMRGMVRGLLREYREVIDGAG